MTYDIDNAVHNTENAKLLLPFIFMEFSSSHLWATAGHMN